MKFRACSIVLLLIATMPVLARAEDWTGIGVFFGIPIMAIASLLFGILAVFRRLHWAVHGLATLIFVPLTWVGFMLYDDAIALFHKHDTEPVYWYFSLFALVIVLYVVIAWKYWRRPALRRAT